MNDKGLEVCPFCGNYPNIGSLGGDNENWSIWCDCGLSVAETGLNNCETKQDIINLWNKRPYINEYLIGVNNGRNSVKENK